MFKRLEGKNRRCLLMVSKGFLEKAERALGGGVKTREGLGTRLGRRRMALQKMWGLLRTARNGGERGGEHVADSGDSGLFPLLDGEPSPCLSCSPRLLQTQHGGAGTHSGVGGRTAATWCTPTEYRNVGPKG